MNRYVPYTERFGQPLSDEFDRKLAAWMEAERQLAQAHIDFAKELSADLAQLLGEDRHG